MSAMTLRATIDSASNARSSKSFAFLLAATASVSALMAGASGASAADLSYKDDRPAIMSYGGASWAGFYFGAQAGAAVDTDRDAEPFGANSGQGGNGGNGATTGGTAGLGGAGGLPAIVETSADGGGDTLVGLHVGYNWQNANVVYGLEADIDANNSLDNLLGSVRARLGFGTDRTLFYITGGLAYISVDGAEAAFVAGAGGAGGNGGASGAVAGASGVAGGAGAAGRIQQDSESDIGVVAGLGIEHKITNQVGIGLEGLYYSFGEDDVGLTNDGDFFAVRARLTMHLDRDAGSIKDSYPALANWGGFYLGGHLGAQLSDDGAIGSTAASGGDGGDGGTNGVGDAGGGGGGGGSGGVAIATLGADTALIGGAHLGYNWQAGAWVYGLEGDASFSDEQYSYLASARARIGYATGSYLFYGTAGVAFAGLDRVAGIEAFNGTNGFNGGNGPDGEGGDGGNGGNAGGVKDEDDVVGFVVGAGVDAKLTDRLTLGLEGLYYGFDVDDKTGGNQSFNSDDADVFVLRSRISYSLTPHVEALK